MNNDDINAYIPSILNPRAVKRHNLSLTQSSAISRCSLSLKRISGLSTAKPVKKVNPTDKENLPNTQNHNEETQKVTKERSKTQHVADDNSLGFSAIVDLIQENKDISPFSLSDSDFNKPHKDTAINSAPVYKTDEHSDNKSDRSAITISSAVVSSKLENAESLASTYIYSVDKPTVRVSFGVNDCDSVDVDARNGAIKNFSVSHKDKNTNIECEVLESSQISTETDLDENMNETSVCPLKRTAVSVSLEIKKQKLTHNDSTENSKVLILNTNAIEKISHIIVQPPNYKFVKRFNSHKSKHNNKKSSVQNETLNVAGLKQVAIDRYFRRGSNALIDVDKLECSANDDAEGMSKNSGVVDATKCDRSRTSRGSNRDLNELPKSAVLHTKREKVSPRRQEVKSSLSESPTPRARNDSLSAHSARKNVESIHFNLPLKSKSNKTSLRNIPHHKIVAGTHFAVDAFSYGEIPNVEHYFLTHFHSDHYSGLKKSFSKLLFCSKITADLCITRLGVNPKNIHVFNVDETLKIDGIEVAAVDANHCPGALMFVFTLLNGKTLLHTGDFRACPYMESYPVFWNKDIHTVYLDTTYCNPRYDFPTQEQSLEMAVNILKDKKIAVEKVGKKFSSVLIVCGTYTIGKEKFFLGLSRRINCSVWACPEKERVLQIVEGRACVRDPPQACQMHVVPMRDLTHEKLRSYLDSLHGAFAEVVAFKPSGWENGKNSKVEKDLVTIHGIPYSEHSSFSELIRFVKFVKPKQVVPTVDISGGVKAVQKYFPCPLVYKEELQCQSKLTDYFSIHTREQPDAVT